MDHINSDFLENHSLHYIEMALRTDKIERIDNPDGYGKRIGDCGDSVEFFLMHHENRIKSVSFFTRGCLNTTACCNTVATFAQGKTIDEAWEIVPEQVIEYLNTLPKDHFHCAELAVGALYLALRNLQSLKSSSV
ncbi:MAG: iron-sulfur cluster assembly scaffold protein [Proteobacteria bacterium]|nr:iron-sulfur cluster assembly scaffold protein [Pseudomonadota bacterium]MBU1582435.1 iron-sulfur cluster assembly scaffold protein [Pseudomonadota bacterium]MBU2453767.1 iron-sulfur cluster assembly scaffold protein [Pseudomonadota bacterium]MBU2630133.1 iron-sulfur cluster assembly scaffold protein [Pseudomonadota bacterium]